MVIRLRRTLFGILAILTFSTEAFVIKNIDRTIDISSQLVKVSCVITLENVGNSALSDFIYVLDHDKSNLAYFHSQSDDSFKTTLNVSDSEFKERSAMLIELREPLQPRKLTVVRVKCVFTHILFPHPAVITQEEGQLMLYNGNHYFYSPYHTISQTTIVNLGSKDVESYTKLKPVSLNDRTIITYGPYENISPYSSDKMAIHYQNNSPFLTVTNLERVIEVSHWGNVAVEETVHIQHTGAVLKGPFSRYEYQREAYTGVPSIKSFKTILPASATDAYYRDEIGNISTSHLKVLRDSVELELRPRFPLFGGWKICYVIGYNLPSYKFLFNAGDKYLLKMRLVDHVFDDMVIDKMTTKIILPEGVHSMKFIPPYHVEHLPSSLHYTYLDVKGRPTIVLGKHNLVENHIQDFKLQYCFSQLLMLQEPLLLIITLYLMLLAVIVYVRLDFSITRDEAGESRTRISGYCEKLLHHQNKRALFYRSYDELLTKLKLERNISQFQVAIKSKNQEYRAETAHIGDLISKVKSESPEIAEKIHELQKADKQLRELYTQHHNLCIDRLVPGKIVRQQFVEYENQINRKKEDYSEKMNNIMKSFQ